MQKVALGNLMERQRWKLWSNRITKNCPFASLYPAPWWPNEDGDLDPDCCCWRPCQRKRADLQTPAPGSREQYLHAWHHAGQGCPNTQGSARWSGRDRRFPTNCARGRDRGRLYVQFDGDCRDEIFCLCMYCSVSACTLGICTGQL